MLIAPYSGNAQHPIKIENIDKNALNRMQHCSKSGYFQKLQRNRYLSYTNYSCTICLLRLRAIKFILNTFLSSSTMLRYDGLKGLKSDLMIYTHTLQSLNSTCISYLASDFIIKKTVYLFNDISRRRTATRAAVTRRTISDRTSWLLCMGKPTKSKSRAFLWTKTLESCTPAHNAFTCNNHTEC